MARIRASSGLRGAPARGMHTCARCSRMLRVKGQEVWCREWVLTEEGIPTESVRIRSLTPCKNWHPMGDK